MHLGPGLQLDGGSDSDRRIVAGRHELHERPGTGDGVPAHQTADAADALARRVPQAAADGEVTEAFATTAPPALQQLADPAAHRALQDLLADVEQDPRSVGPAGQRVLASLRVMAELPVFDQGDEALTLLQLVREEGQVTPAFRDQAAPVLTALVR